MINQVILINVNQATLLKPVFIQVKPEFNQVRRNHQLNPKAKRLSHEVVHVKDYQLEPASHGHQYNSILISI